MLSILRYANELRDPKPYFEGIDAEPPTDAVKLATQLIEAQSGKFEPKTMPNHFAEAMREYLSAKVENRAPEVTIAPEGKPTPPVINIMAALKESMQAKGRAKARDAVRKRSGKAVPKVEVRRTLCRKLVPVEQPIENPGWEQAQPGWLCLGDCS